jgi:hypothetical protein
MMISVISEDHGRSSARRLREYKHQSEQRDR